MEVYGNETELYQPSAAVKLTCHTNLAYSFFSHHVVSKGDTSPVLEVGYLACVYPLEGVSGALEL